MVLLGVSYTLLMEDQDKLTCLPSWTHLILISLCCVTGLYCSFKSWALLNVLLLLLSDSLWPHGLQHAWLPCPSPSPRARSNSCSLSQWCHPSISSSVVPFSCLQSFPASGSFPKSRLFTSSGQSTGASVWAPVFLMNIQGWFPLGLTGLIFLQSKGFSRVFSNTIVGKHQFFSAQPSSWLLEKKHSLILLEVTPHWSWWAKCYMYPRSPSNSLSEYKRDFMQLSCNSFWDPNVCISSQVWILKCTLIIWNKPWWWCWVGPCGTPGHRGLFVPHPCRQHSSLHDLLWVPKGRTVTNQRRSGKETI